MKWVVSFLTALWILGVAAPAEAQVVDVPDVLPPIDDPQALPQELDPAPYEAFLASLAPVNSDLPSAYSELASRVLADQGCALTVNPIEKHGIYLQSSGALECPNGDTAPTTGIEDCPSCMPRNSALLRICIDRVSSGQWVEMGCEVVGGGSDSGNWGTYFDTPCPAGTGGYRTRASSIALSRAWEVPVPDFKGAFSEQQTFSCLTA